MKQSFKTNSSRKDGIVSTRKTNPPHEAVSTTNLRRKSVLQHLETDLSNTETKTFIYRMTAVGSHETVPEEITNFKEKIITGINAVCYDEPATGIFAVYPKHFLHVVEGSENTLNKYIMACASEFEEFGNEVPLPDHIHNPMKVQMKILSFMRVLTRSTEKWVHVIRNETSGREVLDGIRGYRNRLIEFIKSAWILSSVLPIFTQPDDVSPPQDIADFPDIEDQLLIEQAGKDLLIDLEEELNNYFPIEESLQYFMKPKERFPPLLSAQEHMSHYWDLPQIIFDSETVWPIPSRLASYD